MQRRTFLTLCSSAAATTAVAGAWLAAWTDERLQVEGVALFPGAPLRVAVAAHAPAGAALQVRVDHDGRDHLALTLPAPVGDTVELETPYPYDDLVPGAYRVHLALVDGHGRTLESCSVGGYALRRPRFSA